MSDSGLSRFLGGSPAQVLLRLVFLSFCCRDHPVRTQPRSARSCEHGGQLCRTAVGYGFPCHRTARELPCRRRDCRGAYLAAYPFALHGPDAIRAARIRACHSIRCQTRLRAATSRAVRCKVTWRSASSSISVEYPPPNTPATGKPIFRDVSIT